MPAMIQGEAAISPKLDLLLRKPEDRPPAEQLALTFDPIEVIKDLEDLHESLKEADAMLKAIVPYLEPPHHRPEIPAVGEIEFGILPFWAKNPDQIPYEEEIPHVFLKFLKLVDDLGLIPEPTVTLCDYKKIKLAAQNNTAISPDGTSWEINDFGQLDLRWLEAPINMLLVNHDYKKYPWPVPDPKNPALSPLVGSIQADAARGGKTMFAIAGDWGTGAADAVAVRGAAMELNPDYLFHLGDVYYTGTPEFSLKRPFLGSGYENAHLVDFWPKDDLKPGRSFTMNSNHEMYTGAWGLFEDALSSPIFAHQNGFSYGMIENDDWQIFYLDSAYCSPDFLKMYGALSDDQISFVQAMRKGKSNKKTIVMTHHTPFDLTGQIEQISDGKSLLRDVAAALGNSLPDYWYFGHIHDGIVYAPKKVMDTPSGPAIPGVCRMRCTGHASMPYGAPWGLAKVNRTPPFKKTGFIDHIEFFAQSPKLDCGLLVKNGFMTVTLDGDTIEEAFYDSDCVKVWPLDEAPIA
ncbi:metallophosphoesterase family protein [Tateyamaria pelophila]|uniref:metallophosphoesterase family protein n=1 Tax=Tateyamaria pelophila TaxID=328415 RepID=UPI001CBED3CD|nr:metallophosphoesterase [Tateyamaria pelophila]